MTTDATVLKIDYDLCEAENSNLRRCLAWCGKHLTQAQKAELAAMIRQPIAKGGVLNDNAEDEHEHIIELKRLAVKAAGMLEEIIKLPTMAVSDTRITIRVPQDWFAKADDLANKLMEYDPPTPEASLADIRNTQAISDAIERSK